jgi:hypothetical protein
MKVQQILLMSVDHLFKPIAESMDVSRHSLLDTRVRIPLGSPAIAISWRCGWLETEVRTPQGGYITGRSTDVSGNIEGYHSRPDSPVVILVDEAKSVDEEVFEALSRCTATFRLYASSTGPAFGFFHSLFTSRSAYWRTYRIRSTDCAHIPQSQIDADREADGEHSSTFRIKHLSEFLYDSGQTHPHRNTSKVRTGKDRPFELDSNKIKL